MLRLVWVTAMAGSTSWVVGVEPVMQGRGPSSPSFTFGRVHSRSLGASRAPHLRSPRTSASAVVVGLRVIRAPSGQRHGFMNAGPGRPHWFSLNRQSRTNLQIPLIWSGICCDWGDIVCRRFRGSLAIESQASRGRARKTSRRRVTRPLMRACREDESSYRSRPTNPGNSPTWSGRSSTCAHCSPLRTVTIRRLPDRDDVACRSRPSSGPRGQVGRTVRQILRS
jgi:hypothetical protein